MSFEETEQTGNPNLITLALEPSEDRLTPELIPVLTRVLPRHKEGSNVASNEEPNSPNERLTSPNKGSNEGSNVVHRVF